MQIHSHIQIVTDFSFNPKKKKHRHLTVNQLNEPVTVVHIICLAGSDATQLVADPRVFLRKDNKLVRLLDELLEH